MALQANQSYEVTVTGAGLVESQQGTLSIEMMFRTESGDAIPCNLWLTENASERTALVMAEAFGVTNLQLSDPDFYNAGLIKAVVGAKCSITTGEEEYKGKTRVKVRWVNPLRKPVTKDAARRAAMLFKAEPDLGITDDDVPF